MKNVVLLFVLTMIMSRAALAQSCPVYIHPEYKIRTRDTTGTYLQIINYFDRTFYQRDIYLKEILPDGSSTYTDIKINPLSGLGILPTKSLHKQNLQIAKCLEIENIKIKKNAINRIEIRDENGFLNMRYCNPIKNQQSTKVKVINTVTKDSFETDIPETFSLPLGMYEIVVNVNPPLRKTVYIKPAQINRLPIYRSIPVKFMGLNNDTQIKIDKYNYKTKRYEKVFTIASVTENPTFYFLPRAKYKIYYKRKGKRRFRSAVFYLTKEMQEFIKVLK